MSCARIPLAIALLMLAGCGGAAGVSAGGVSAGARTPNGQSSRARPGPPPIPAAAAFHPPLANAEALAGGPVDGMRCAGATRRFAAHVELFARRAVILLPAGIGLARPLLRVGRWLVSARCSYPLRTREPTGVVEVAAGPPRTLGELFALWGQALSARRIAGFTSPTASVRAFVGGRPRPGPPGAIVLSPHAEIVLELDGYVPPHAHYRFPKGL